MKRILILFLFLLFQLATFHVFAQQNKINDLINQQQFDEAISLLIAMGPTENIDNEALVSLGYCYIMTKDFSNAEFVYEELSKRKRSGTENTLYYAELLLINKKFAEAKENFVLYKTKNPSRAIIDIKINSCDSLMKWSSIVSSLIVRNAGEINTKLHEMNACIIPNGLFFISNRSYGENQSLVVSPVSSGYVFENSALKEWDSKLNSTYSSGAACYCQECDILAFTLKKATRNLYDVALGNSQIYFVAKTQSGTYDLVPFLWAGMPKEYNVAHPAFTKNGKRLYFSSDIPGGMGGMDLYYSDFVQDSWTAPVNLGAEINTSFDELFPVIWGDTALYYSTAGLPGYGNLDVFVSNIRNGKHSAPSNVKGPINSIGDDFSYVPVSQRMGYFTSNRSSLSKGGYDIFSWEYPQVIVPVETIPIKRDTFYADQYPIPFILFETGSSEISSVYFQMLNELADTMNKYSFLTIDITGFTDITGNDAFNDKLSVNRSQSIADYLIKKGVDLHRISVRGAGKSRLADLPGVKYHVQVGSLTTSGHSDWFRNHINSQCDVIEFSFKKRFVYAACTFSTSAEAKQQALQFKTAGIDCFVIASYFGNKLPDYILSVNRRTELKLK